MLEYDDPELRTWLATLDADPHADWVDAQRGRLAAAWESRTITAPPPAAFEFDTIAEPLESRSTRSRRDRRLVIAAAAVVLAIVVLVVLATHPGVDRRGVQTPLGTVPTPPASTVAPLVEGPDPASTLLTSWGQFHVGYVLVYADGRVLFYPDIGAGVLPKGVTRYEINERHLSPRGLDLVRAGKLDPKSVLVGPHTHKYQRSYSRKNLWVEPTARLWEPTTYALCPFRPNPGGPRDVPVNATDIVDELPAPVRTVLDGRQRNSDPSIGTAHWVFPRTPEQGITDCFELTAAETSNLYQMLIANGLISGQRTAIRGPQGWDLVFVYGDVAFAPEAIFPHGQRVIWGG